jgi:hypothetical protein
VEAEQHRRSIILGKGDEAADTAMRAQVRQSLEKELQDYRIKIG